MGDIFFFIKMIVLSGFFILFLQVRIGQNTVEEHAMLWSASAPVLEPVKEVAKGGVIAIKRSWGVALKQLGGKVSGFFSKDHLPGNRTLGVNLERSERFLKEKAETAKASAKRYIEETEQTLIERGDDLSEDEPETY